MGRWLGFGPSNLHCHERSPDRRRSQAKRTPLPCGLSTKIPLRRSAARVDESSLSPLSHTAALTAKQQFAGPSANRTSAWLAWRGAGDQLSGQLPTTGGAPVDSAPEWAASTSRAAAGLARLATGSTAASITALDSEWSVADTAAATDRWRFPCDLPRHPNFGEWRIRCEYVMLVVYWASDPII
jgi:hypothetical protein